MSESDEFMDTFSELKAFGFITFPNEQVEEEEEFFDVIELDDTVNIPIKLPTEPSSLSEHVDSYNYTPNTTMEMPLLSPPISSIEKRLSVLEFLENDPDPADVDFLPAVPVRDMNKRETIFEFLAETYEDSITSQASESSLSRLQDELREEDHFEFRDDELRRHDILNLPDHHSILNHPSHRESLLRRANPLASFFSSDNPRDSSDSDSMISELTETLTTRTEASDLRLSRHASMLENGYGNLRLAKRYKPVPVKTKSKQKSEFSSLFLIQELNRRQPSSPVAPYLNRADSTGSTANSEPTDPSKAIFVLKFSPDGHFLAAAGAEGTVKIWCLRQIDSEDPAATSSAARVATIFEIEPVQVFRGHSAEILDCAWSVNNFLLSASMDKTVRLWHHSRPDALGIFQHLDYVTSVAFHPRDPRIFLSGSLDCKLRIWSIQDRNILHWNELPPGNFITAVAFTRSGSVVIAGTSRGTALIFDTEGLRYNTQILVRSSRSKSVGKKITSIESVPGQYDNDERVNRVRIVQLTSICFRS